MKRFATLFVALGLATAGSTAFGEQTKKQVSKQESKPQLVQMTESQLDSVSAGALVNVFAVDVIDVDNVLNRNEVVVQVPVNAAVAAGVLGAAAAGAAQQSRLNR
jgi:hypothetical protein